MGTVPIAATHGAGGSVVAPAVAERLRLALVDRAIPIALAHELAGPLEDALAEDAVRQPGPARPALRLVLDLSRPLRAVPLPPPPVGPDHRADQTARGPPRASAPGRP